MLSLGRGGRGCGRWTSVGMIEAAMRGDLQTLIAEQRRTNQLLEHVSKLLAQLIEESRSTQPRQWHPPTPPWQETGVPR